MRTFPVGLLFLLLSLPSLSSQQVLPGAPSAEAAAARLGSQVAWNANDPLLLPEGNRFSSGRKILMENRKATAAFDRVAALEKALAEAAGRKRLVLWYIPWIKGRQMYRPALLDLYMKAVPFTDPECVDMVNRRFVPVRLVCDAKLQKKTGITAPDTVGPVLVFMDPQGRIIRKVDRIRTFNVRWFRELMRDVLAQNKAFSGPGFDPRKPGGEEGEPRELRLGREYLRDGDLQAAVAHLKRAAKGKDEIDGITALHLLAQAYRRSGRTKPALEAVRRASEAIEKAAAAKESKQEKSGVRERLRRRRVLRGIGADLDCEHGRILLFQEELDEAAAAFSSCRSGRRHVEALFYLGMVEYFRGSNDLARHAWSLALASDPEDPFAWKAAANLVNGPDLTPLGPTPHGFETPFEPRRPLTPVTDTSAPVPPARVRELARAAVRTLLRLQRDHGGWTDGRYAYWNSPELTPNVWVAATATSCAALLEWRDIDPDAIDEAVRRGEEYMFDERRMARGFNEEIYAEGFKLQYLARKYDLARSSKDRARAVDLMNECVSHLGRLQDDRGFWAHEYPNPFCTASVMSGLEKAAKRGARVPKAMLLRGAEALLSTRAENGSYSYSAGRGRSTPKDAMGRMPICEAVILGSGHKKGSLKNLEAAMENFWKHLPRLEKIRKCDFHTDGELGGFFFWHAVYHTAEAISALPRKEQESQRKAMLRHVLKIAEFDGSFIDSHEFGKSYGTSMGLLTLKAALDDRKP